MESDLQELVERERIYTVSGSTILPDTSYQLHTKDVPTLLLVDDSVLCLSHYQEERQWLKEFRNSPDAPLFVLAQSGMNPNVQGWIEGVYFDLCVPTRLRTEQDVKSVLECALRQRKDSHAGSILI